MLSVIVIRLKIKLKSWLRSNGLELNRSDDSDFGRDPFTDMKLLCPTEHPLILDVGANVGESTTSFLNIFADPVIHSFEPGRVAYHILNKLFASNKKVTTWQTAIGSSNAPLLFYENLDSTLSSLLPMLHPSAGQITSKYPVSTDSLDSFLSSNDITLVDILKIDVQGFELEVLKGTSFALRRNFIRLIYIDLSFDDYYANSAGFEVVLRFLLDNSFLLVGFYRQHFRNNILAYSDALLINKSFIS